MKKYLMGIAVGLALAACGQQQSETAPAQPKQEMTAEQAKYVLCGQALDLTAEQLLKNMDEGLRATKASPAILDQKLTANDCGYTLEMAMTYGAIRLELDEQQKVRNLAVGYQNISGQEGLLKNMNNALASVQTVMSINGSAKFGETELGKKLFTTLIDLMAENKNSAGAATKDVDFDGKRYTVGIEGRTVAIVVRKIP